MHQFAYMCVVQLYILYPALEVKYAGILAMLPVYLFVINAFDDLLLMLYILLAFIHS